MLRHRLTLVASLTLLLAAACDTEPEPAPATPGAHPPTPSAAAAVVTTPAGFTRLTGALPPLARLGTDAGPVDPATRLSGMSLTFHASASARAQGRAVLADLENPTSPRYHHWLKPADVAPYLGATAAQVARARAWLQLQGFSALELSPTGTRLFFDGSVGQLEQAFHTEMHRYVVQGERHFALAVAPAVPVDLAPFVSGLRGVHDFRLHPANRRPPHGPKAPDDGLYLDASLWTNAGPSDFLSIAPADFASIYDVAPLYAQGITGAGQKIGIVGDSDFNTADIQAFRTAFGLDATNLPTRDLVPHSGNPVYDYDDMSEAELDLEWSGGIAKEASVYFVFVGDNPAYSVTDAMLWAVEEGTYPVVSISFAGCEVGSTASEDIYMEQLGDAAAMEGVTVLAASGDWGAAGCEGEALFEETAASMGESVGSPASIPSVVAVGGTEFSWGDPIPEASLTAQVASAAPFDTYWSCELNPVTCAPKGYVPETAWNEVSYELTQLQYLWGSSGGGVSTLFQKPYWQVGQTPAGSTRMVPDVSLSAAWSQVGYVMYFSWTAADGDGGMPTAEAPTLTGGTSAATPSFAGILTLVNHAVQKNAAAPVGLGNANPLLYALAASTKNTASPAFHDITTGNNVMPCQPGTPSCPSSPPYQYGYQAGAGYDMVTGLGSVDVANLVKAWTTLTPTSTTVAVAPSGHTEASPVSLTATVASTATANPLTGSVIFYVDTTTDAGVPDLSIAVTAPIVPSASGPEGGTASATTTVPGGVLGVARVVAFYAGDAHYLASWSALSTVSETSTLAIVPASLTLNPNAQATFTAQGGVPPIQWYVGRDSTCYCALDASADACASYGCSYIESLGPTTGAFQAGANDGTSTVVAVDADGAEVQEIVIVTGAPVDGGLLPFVDAGIDSSPPFDAGVDSSIPDSSILDSGPGTFDSGTTTQGDAAVLDATSSADTGSPQDSGPPGDASSDAKSTTPPASHKSGCSCTAAGAPSTDWHGGAAFALLFGLALVRGRRLRRLQFLVF